jgi:hypothetical protein
LAPSVVTLPHRCATARSGDHDGSVCPTAHAAISQSSVSKAWSQPNWPFGGDQAPGTVQGGASCSVWAVLQTSLCPSSKRRPDNEWPHVELLGTYPGRILLRCVGRVFLSRRDLAGAEKTRARADAVVVLIKTRPSPVTIRHYQLLVDKRKRAVRPCREVIPVSGIVGRPTTRIVKDRSPGLQIIG